MAAPFFAMAGVHWLALIMLYAGLVLSLTATVLYVRRGLAEARGRPESVGCASAGRAVRLGLEPTLKLSLTLMGCKAILGHR